MSIKYRTEPGRRERKKGETRSRIIDIAVDLFRKQGFESTTVDQIAEKADVAKGTLYNYFPSKESILHGYAQQGAAETMTRTESLIESLPDTGARLSALFGHLSTWLKANRDLYMIYLRYRLQNLGPGLGHDQRSGLSNVLEAVIIAGQKSGELRKDIPSQMLALHLEMMYFGACMCWLTDPRSCPLNKRGEQVISLFLNGASKNSTSKGLAHGERE